MTVHRLTVLAWDPPRLRLFVECGPGTYIRALARDLGEALGSRGYLHALRRVRSGAFRVEQTATPAQVEDGGVQRFLQRSDLAVVDLPAAVLDDEDVMRVRQGRAVNALSGGTSPLRLYDQGGSLLALAEPHGEVVKPFLVFPAAV